MHQPWAQHPPGPPDPVPGAHPGTHLISISAKLLASVLKEGKRGWELFEPSGITVVHRTEVRDPILHTVPSLSHLAAASAASPSSSCG